MQTRYHNAVNEIDGNAGNSITASTGTNWADPTYDNAGNMTTSPQPSAPASSFTLKYDAWNRLVNVTDGSSVDVDYEFDGLNRLIVRTTSSETRQFYYTEDWKVVEEQVGTTASTARPDVQYVWGTQYVDDLVVRFRDADASGSSGAPSLEEELYSLADANFNVTTVTDNDGDVVERFTYTPYGESTVLDPDFNSYTGTDYDWKYRYTTRELDPLTGKQINRNRWYDALLGRWVSRDPIGYEGGSNNLYEYVNGMPLGGFDPIGLTRGLDFVWIFAKRIQGLRWVTDWIFGDFYELADGEGTIISDNKSKSESFARQYLEDNKELFVERCGENNLQSITVEPFGDIRGKYNTGQWVVKNNDFLGRGGYWLNGSHEIQVLGGAIYATKCCGKVTMVGYEINYVWHDSIDAKSFYENWDTIMNALRASDGENAIAAILEGYYDLFGDKLLDLDYRVGIRFTDSALPP